MEDHVIHRCIFCKETRHEFDATTPLPKRMKTVIKKIEDRIKSDSVPYEEGINRDKGFWYY